MSINFDHFVQPFNANVLYSIYRNKYVEVTTCDYKVIEGWLKSIDPHTSNAILVHFDNGSFRMKSVSLVLGKYIRLMRVLKEGNPKAKAELEKLYVPPEVVEVDTDRRDRLIYFLKAHRLSIQVIEDGQSLLVINCVKIRPPYILESCMTSNTSVLTSIKMLLDSFDLNDLNAEANSSPGLSISKSSMQNVAVEDCTGKEALYVADVNMNYSFKNAADEYPSGEGASNKSTIEKRKNELLSWFKYHQCPVRELGSDEALLVCECVTIFPPYDIESCISTCKTILGPICELVHRFNQPAVVQVNERVDAYAAYYEEFDFNNQSNLLSKETSSDDSSSRGESVCGEVPYNRKPVPDDAVTSSDESTSVAESFEFIVNP